jgi:cephalosporin hydroxylase
MSLSPNEARFRTSVYGLLEEVEQRRKSVQHEVPTAFDKSLWHLAVLLARFDASTPWEQSCGTLPGPEGAHIREALAVLKGIVARRAQGRYVAYRDRLAGGGSDMTPTMLAMASGLGSSLMWRDLPLFKTAFDLAIYSMLLWELKPTLIVEIGSGTGASAIWLADLMRMFRIEGKIVTFDCQALDLAYEGIEYVRGDCRTIARDFNARIVAANAGPTLLVEDAHVNVEGVLDHFHPVLKQGDYVIVEDSLSKRDVLTEWTDRHQEVYQVDSRFVDFFGHNVTTAQDSIFVRML